jgi:hypothetical protein
MIIFDPYLPKSSLYPLCLSPRGSFGLRGGGPLRLLSRPRYSTAETCLPLGVLFHSRKESFKMCFWLEVFLHPERGEENLNVKCFNLIGLLFSTFALGMA